MPEVTCALCGAEIDELDAVEQDGVFFCSEDCADDYEADEDDADDREEDVDEVEDE
jgi:hypothetical protein